MLITPKQNDKARNAAFGTKKDVYAQPDPKGPLLAITRDVLSAVEWRRSDIEAREEGLLALVQKMWRVDLSAGKPGARTNVVLALDKPNVSPGPAVTKAPMR